MKIGLHVIPIALNMAARDLADEPGVMLAQFREAREKVYAALWGEGARSLDEIDLGPLMDIGATQEEAAEFVITTEQLLDHARRMDGACHKFLDPLSDKTLFRRLYDATPRSEWVLRNHQRSEDKSDLLNHPASTGQRHANEWANELSALGLSGSPRVLVEGINEWIPNSPAAAAAINAYSLAFLVRLTALGLRGLAPMFSVGWPPQGSARVADWAPYRPTLDYIKANLQHGLGLHEYWPGSGPAEGWGYLAGRVMHCPVKGLPLYITECGNDNVLDNGKRGWKDWGLTPAQIAAQCLDYARRLEPLGFVVKGIHPFTTGGAHEWASFYMQGEPNHLLAEAAQSAPVPPPPAPPPPPPPTPPPTGGSVPIHPDVQDPTFPDVFYRVKPAANKAGGYYRVKSFAVERSGQVIVIGHVTGGPAPVWHFRWPDGDHRAPSGGAGEMGPGAKFTTPDGGPHWIYAGDDETKSESVHNIGLPVGEHTVFRAAFEWVTESTPPPSPPPAPVPAPPPPTPGPGGVPAGDVVQLVNDARWQGEQTVRDIEGSAFPAARLRLLNEVLPRLHRLESLLKGKP